METTKSKARHKLTEKEILEKEMKTLEQEEQKTLEKIKSSGSPNIDRFFSDMMNFVTMVAKPTSDIHSLFLIGDSAVGKSFNTIRALVNGNIDFKYVAGNISPLACYILLYENRDKVIIFDDTIGLVRNRQTILQGLWSPEGDRFISWNSTSGKLTVSPRFKFSGKIIFMLNEIPSTLDFKVLLSRCMCYHMGLDYREVLQLMYEIAKLKHNSLNAQERIGVVDFIRDNTNEATEDFNLRLQKKVESIYLYDKTNWIQLSRTLINENKAKNVVLELIKSNIPIQEQIRQFREKTDMSRASYFRYKNEVSKSHEIGGVNDGGNGENVTED